MPLYRCNNCGKEFEATRPACATCNIDPKVDPRFHAIVVRIETIHFDPPSHVRHFGIGKRPCDGKSIKGGMATAVPAVVTCKRCRDTDVWKKAADETGLEITMIDGQDEEVAIVNGIVKTGADVVGVVIARDPNGCC